LPLPETNLTSSDRALAIIEDPIVQILMARRSRFSEG